MSNVDGFDEIRIFLVVTIRIHTMLKGSLHTLS
jgi:hypothetical protein